MKPVLLFIFLSLCFLMFSCSAKNKQTLINIGGCTLKCVSKCTAEHLSKEAFAFHMKAMSAKACKLKTIKPTSKPTK